MSVPTATLEITHPRPKVLSMLFFKRRPASPHRTVRTEPPRANLAPLTQAPTATRPVAFIGAEAIDELPGRVVYTWELADSQTVALLHSTEHPGGHASWLRELRPELNYAVSIRDIEDISGPELSDLATPDTDERHQKKLLPWRELARVLGQPAPYWPKTTRYREHMLDWQPGQPRLTVPALLSIDLEPLLQLAAHLPQDDTLRHLLQLNYSRHLYDISRRSRGFGSWITGDLALADAADDHEMLSDHDLNPREITIAAVARHVAPTPSPRETGITIDAERAAWLQLLDADDTLAETVTRLLSSSLSGFPWAFKTIIRHEHGPAAAQWINGLEPSTLPRGTLGYFDPSEQYRPITGTYVEPVTGAPVVRYDDRRGTEDYLTPKPKRLATTCPLAEVILEGDAWIRTADGHLHLCPTADDGPTWGYGGTGPSVCAATIGRLLDDITTTAAGIRDHNDDAEHGGLYTLFSSSRLKDEGPHIISREQLLALRDH